MDKLSVVVIGGGFGGLSLVRKLTSPDVKITLLDKRNFHLFQPLLYQVATGGLSPGDIAAPLRSVLHDQRNVTVLLDEVVSIDPFARSVHVKNSPSVPYDVLVLATGSESHYFGNEEWAAYAPTLKTIEDATEIRRRILLAFEMAEREADAEVRREWLRFVVVGGGPTGVELAGALGEIARDTLRNDFRRIRPEEAQILLIDAGARILPAMRTQLSDKAERALIHLGVRTRTNLMVTGVEEGKLTLKTPHGTETINTRTILWAAGVRANHLGKQLASSLGIETDKGGRISVRDDLSIDGHPELFVIGDLAMRVQKGDPLPGMAPVAMQEGEYVAKLIDARLRGKTLPPFHYVNKGTMATIGRKRAVVDLGFVYFNGALAWFTWLVLHLLYLVTFRSRVSVALQWAFQYATFNRGARLITSSPQPAK